jgi:hypothetical protein
VREKAGRIVFAASEAAIPQLSQALVEAGALIAELAPESATLEDLFFSLTEDQEPEAPAAEPDPALVGEAA